MKGKIMDKYITDSEAAEILGLTKQYLAVQRSKGMGLKFYKPTPRRVLYKYSEVINFIESTGATKTKKRENNGI